MKKHLLVFSFTLVVVLLPAVAAAQFGDVDSYITSLAEFINRTIIPLLLAIAFLVFIYGIFLYFFYNSDNEESRGKGQKLILWSVIGFVLIASVWGIVNLLADGLDLKDTRIENLPDAPLGDDPPTRFPRSR